MGMDAEAVGANGEGWSLEVGGETRDPDPATAAPVLEALEVEQLAQNRARHFPRRSLKRRHLALIWVLRVYVVLMIAVVIYQIWTRR